MQCIKKFNLVQLLRSISCTTSVYIEGNHFNLSFAFFELKWKRILREKRKFYGTCERKCSALIVNIFVPFLILEIELIVTGNRRLKSMINKGLIKVFDENVQD